MVRYDARLLAVDPPPEEVILGDQKRIVVDTYTRYRIDNPLLFYQAVRNEDGVRARLREIVNNALRKVLGNVMLPSVLSPERENIMHQIQQQVSEAAKPLGITVVDVRIRRADLPPETSQSIYARMKSERQREAAEARAQGQEKAQEIRASAERERTVILAEAQRQSNILKGEGEAEFNSHLRRGLWPGSAVFRLLPVDRGLSQGLGRERHDFPALARIRLPEVLRKGAAARKQIIFRGPRFIARFPPISAAIALEAVSAVDHV